MHFGSICGILLQRWYLWHYLVVRFLLTQSVHLQIILLAVKPDSAVSNPSDQFGTGFGKPKFPAVDIHTTLADLVGQDSWFLFNVLSLDEEFLNQDFMLWPFSTSYKTSAEHILAINVINDCAERCVKLSSDFLSSAESEQHYQNVLQIVEHNRTDQPHIRKRTKKY